MKLFLSKLIWLILTILGYVAICFMLELPMTTIVCSIIDREDPALVTAVTFTVGFLLMLYAVYLKRLRNDKERRQYLTNIRRRYGSLKTDLYYTVKTKNYQYEVFVFAAVMLILAIYNSSFVWQGDNPGVFWSIVWILLNLLGGSLLTAIYAAGNLWMLNRVHVAWLAALEVPEEADEAVELRRKKTAMKRNLLFQFAFSLSFYLLYLYNSYAVTFAVVVTPTLFLYSHVQSIMGITHMRNIDQPYKLYGILHCVSLAFYIFALMFGVFAPK